VGRNIAENLARLGIETVLLGAVGDDLFGKLIREQTSGAGVDVSRIIASSRLPTGRYVSVTGPDHDAITAVSDMNITGEVSVSYLETHEPVISRSGMLVLDANLPGDTITRGTALARKHGIPVLIEPVSAQKAGYLENLDIRATYLTPNALEYRVLSGSDPDFGKPNAVKWCETVCVTLGPEGVLKLKQTAAGNARFPSRRVRIIDENGAGDAFTAGFVAGLMYGWTEDEAVRAGIRAAVMTLGSSRTVCPVIKKSALEGNTTEE